ncbi:glucose-induced degradation protein 8 homolog isoform X2 [Drosophila grimshawi]|uniref:GH21398 n=3 Tax=Drosophila grimshawi TaxID=7222 RepID=B4J923_DROGR|nr:glucose-induced degradation protein 8 homolog isoform X2 [Drosophila grimshawi]EDW01372.1 GH21398 [Drosophila grimshawi]
MAGNEQKDAWAQRMKSFQTKQVDINRIIMKYLITDGYMGAAQRFEAAAKLQEGGLQNTPDHLARVKHAVRAGQLQYALDLAKKLYPKLYESDNYMYFHMQQLRLIELIRERKHLNVGTNANSSSFVSSDPFQMEQQQQPSGSQPSCRAEQISSELDCMAMIENEQAACMEPKMMFLVKLILWAQGKLDKDGVGCGLDLECEDFELELRRALQKKSN